MPLEFELESYLARVGLTEVPKPDEQGLRALHRAQFFSIPFENLDIQLNRGISLDPDDLVTKLVHGRRGGYCFELNGLLLMALRSLGFSARPLLARVHLHEPPSGRTHQLALVDIGGRPWIIDAGFGAGGLRCPLPLESGRTEQGPGWAFRLEDREPWGIMMSSREDGRWKDSYSFDLTHVTAADIAVGNHYTSTSPASHFVTSRVASLPLEEGRVSLKNFTLSRIEGGSKTTREIPPGRRYLVEVEEAFGIDLGTGFDDLRDLPPGD